MGFIINLIPHVLIITQYGFDLEGPMPSYMYVLIGVCYSMYMYFDNCDGKQARRTGNSSPLGMILDHQCDVIVSVINSFIIQRMLQTGNDSDTLFTMYITTLPFYFVLLEQYYTGEMNFPPVNGVDEGTLIYFVFAMLTAYYGSNELWLESSVNLLGYDMNYMQVFKLVCRVMLPNCALIGMYMIYSKSHYPHFKKVWNASYYALQALFYILSLGTFHIGSIYSAGQVWKTHPRVFQMAHGLQYIYVCLILQYCMVTLEQVNPFKRTVVLGLVL